MQGICLQCLPEKNVNIYTYVAFLSALSVSSAKSCLAWQSLPANDTFTPSSERVRHARRGEPASGIRPILLADGRAVSASFQLVCDPEVESLTSFWSGPILTEEPFARINQLATRSACLLPTDVARTRGRLTTHAHTHTHTTVIAKMVLSESCPRRLQDVNPAILYQVRCFPLRTEILYHVHESTTYYER